MLKESASGIRVQSCDRDKIIVKEKKRKRKVKNKIRRADGRKISEETCGYKHLVEPLLLMSTFTIINNRHNPKRRCIININYILIQIN